MCNSGFYRIPGSNVCFPFSVFFLLTTDLLIVFFRKSLLFLSFFPTPSSQPIPSFYNGVLVFSGNRWFPCFVFLRTEHVPFLSLGKSHFPFFLFFPSFSSDLLKVSWLITFFGTCWGMPFSASPFLWQFPLFPFLSHLGEILFYQLWKPLVTILFFVLPCSGSPRFSSVCAMRCRWVLLAFVLFCFLFLIFFFCLFLSSCPSLPLSLCLKGSAPFDGSWGSLLFIPCHGSFFFFLDASSSGLQDPLGLFISFMGLLHMLLWA